MDHQYCLSGNFHVCTGLAVYQDQCNLIVQGLLIGLLLGFAFVLLSSMTSGMFAKNPYGLAWITGGFTTVGLGIGGAVLGAWKKYKA